jgi:N utilization substance protein A
VDVVQWRDDTAAFITEALGPAKVKSVRIDETTKIATVVVSEHQLSLAIGKEGQNARLAARLSGYKIDIRSDQEESQVPVAAAAAPKAPTVEPVEPDQAVSDPVVEPVEPDQAVSDPVVEPVEPDQAVPASAPVGEN